MVACNHWANGQSTWYVVSRTADGFTKWRCRVCGATRAS